MTADFARAIVRNRGSRVAVQVFAQRLDRNRVETTSWVSIPGMDTKRMVEQWYDISLPDAVGNIVDDWTEVLLDGHEPVTINGRPVVFWSTERGVHAWAGLVGTRGQLSATEALAELVRNIVRGELVEVE